MKQTTNPSEESQTFVRHHHHGFNPIGGIFLIVIGILFLLNTTGLVTTRVWSILWRFWPLVLILLGLRILLGRTQPAKIIMIIITCLIFLYILLTAVALTTPAFYFWVMHYIPWLAASMMPFRQTMPFPIQY